MNRSNHSQQSNSSSILLIHDSNDMMEDSFSTMKSVRFIDVVEAGHDSINQNLGKGRNWKATMGEDFTPSKCRFPISPPTKPKRQRSVGLDDANEFDVGNSSLSPPRIPTRRSSIEIDFVKDFEEEEHIIEAAPVDTTPSNTRNFTTATETTVRRARAA